MAMAIRDQGRPKPSLSSRARQASTKVAQQRSARSGIRHYSFVTKTDDAQLTCLGPVPPLRPFPELYGFPPSSGSFGSVWCLPSPFERIYRLSPVLGFQSLAALSHPWSSAAAGDSLEWRLRELARTDLPDWASSSAVNHLGTGIG